MTNMSKVPPVQKNYALDDEDEEFEAHLRASNANLEKVMKQSASSSS